MDFATIIREARTSSGLTQAGLAQRAGISSRAVWEIENQGSGTVTTLSALADGLDLRFSGLPRGKSLGDQIKTMRLRRGWSQQKLASRVGVSVPAIIRLEIGN